MSDVEHSRLYHVGIILVCPIGLQITADPGGVQLASVMGRKCQHLVSRSFHRSGFVVVDMPGVSGDDSLAVAQYGTGRQSIDLCSSDKQIYLRFGSPQASLIFSDADPVYGSSPYPRDCSMLVRTRACITSGQAPRI